VAPALSDALSFLLIALALDAALAWLPGLREAQRAPADGVAALARWFDRRLNRERRGPNTRFARGVVVVVVIGALAVSIGVLLHDLARERQVTDVAALLFLIFQRAPFDSARRVARGLAEGDHGAARLAIEDLARGQAQLWGGTLWYLVFGLPGLCLYRAVVEIDAATGARGAYGRPARLAATAMGAIPSFVAAVAMALAATFAPRANPARALATALSDFKKHASPDQGLALGAIAGAFGLALGGGPWIGEGRARVTAQDVRGAAYLYAVAALIHVLCIALALAAYSPI
jgi:adenosylcobinamide-phosphate synthase